MKEILRRISVPTGDILLVKGSRGTLECLSLGDYGKDVNLNQNKPVVHTDIMPLSKKWVITISTQYGCSMNCLFCNVPMVGPGINTTVEDMITQVLCAISIHPEVTETERLNIHYARMGEPSFNRNVLDVTYLLKEVLSSKLKARIIHPVVSTMAPKANINFKSFIAKWINIKNNDFIGDAGLQLSINSTNDDERYRMFSGNCMSLIELSNIMQDMPNPIGRKYTLNFALANYEINPARLRRLFPPERFIVKLTPMHKTDKALINGIETLGDYTTPEPYTEIERRLKLEGFDTLVFIASKEEDESGITCGNALLSEDVEG